MVPIYRIGCADTHKECKGASRVCRIVPTYLGERNPDSHTSRKLLKISNLCRGGGGKVDQGAIRLMAVTSNAVCGCASVHRAQGCRRADSSMMCRRPSPESQDGLISSEEDCLSAINANPARYQKGAIEPYAGREKSVLGLAEVFVAGFDVSGCFGIERFEKLKKLGRLEGFEIVGCAGAVGRAGCIDHD